MAGKPKYTQVVKEPTRKVRAARPSLNGRRTHEGRRLRATSVHRQLQSYKHQEHRRWRKASMGW